MNRYITILTFSIFFSFNYAFSQDWVRMGESIYGIDSLDYYGNTISMSSDGNTVAIGSPNNSNNGPYSGLVRAYTFKNNRWVQKGQAIAGRNPDNQFGEAVSLSGDGNTLAIASNRYSGIAKWAGHVRIYTWANNNWIQKGKDLEGENEEDLFGSSISLNKDGSSLVVSSIGYSKEVEYGGKVEVYHWNDDQWEQKGSAILGLQERGYLGYTVSISADGQNFAIGDPSFSSNNESSGSVHVYEWAFTDWILKGETIVDNEHGGWFGGVIELSQDGKHLVVSAPHSKGSNSLDGCVKVFRWSALTWVQVGSDIRPDIVSRNYGTVVSISENGDVIAFGVDGSEIIGRFSGHYEVHALQGNTWEQIGKEIIGDSLNSSIGKGLALSADGNKVAVGFPYGQNTGGIATRGKVKIMEICFPTHSSLDVSASCSYTSPSGKQLETTGLHYDTLTNIAGCDSIISINLKIKKETFLTQDPMDITANEGESASFVVFSSGGDLQWQQDIGYGFSNVKDTFPFSGVKQKFLRLEKLSLSNHNQRFRCINALGSCRDTSDPALLTIRKSLGLDGVQFGQDVVIYPNPSSGYINLIISDSGRCIQNYSITNIVGEVVLTSDAIGSELRIDVNTLLSGHYVLTILWDDDSRSDAKFVVH